MNQNIKKFLWGEDILLSIDRIGMTCILLVSYLYAVFGSTFAESNVTTPVLGFPVFIGEILIGILLVLFGTKFFIKKKRNEFVFTRWHDLIIVFFAWIIGRALIGYVLAGALAFRNAALFYYTIFVLFAYSFYNRKLLTQGAILSVVSLLGITLFLREFHDYFWFTAIVLYIAFALKIKQRYLKYLSFACVVFLFDQRMVFQISRSHLFSIIAAFIFLTVYFGFMKAKMVNIKFIAIIVLSLGVLGSMVYKYSEKNTLKSITAIEDLKRTFQHYENYIELRKDRHYFDYFPAKLYANNSERSALFIPSAHRRNIWTRHKQGYIRSAGLKLDAALENSSSGPHKEFIKKYKEKIIAAVEETLEENREVFLYGRNVDAIELTATISEAVDDVILRERVGGLSEESINEKVLAAFKEKYMKTASQGRSVESNMGNVIFRLMIWRDMRRQLIEEKAIWGIIFGKPLRSPSLEVLNIGVGEWSRDGWVTAHNVYFNIIYRLGIVGLVFIGVLFWIFVRIVKSFSRSKSLVGGLFVGILVYWLTISGFLVILELPYYAIPFWSLLGLVWAYNKDLRQTNSLEPV